MSKKVILWAICIVVIIIIAGFYYYSSISKVEDAKVEDKTPTLQVSIPVINPVENTNPFREVKTNPFE